MNKAVRYLVSEGIAVLTIDSPPVNSLGRNVREGLMESLKKAQGSAEVKGIVVTGTAGFFSAGADITEFAGARSGQMAPVATLVDVIDAFEGSNKPIVAAINGYALGGGFELALGCHWRVAGKKVKFGLPEVNLGLLPGAGGTQRLPRVAGADFALNLMVGGRPAGALKAKEVGVFDAVVLDDRLLETAVSMAKEKSAHPDELPGRRFNARKVPHSSEESRKVLSKITKWAQKIRPGEAAPTEIIACVEAACDDRLTLAEGLRVERERFQILMKNPQSAAMQHMFFAERQAPKLANSLAKPVEVKTVGIVGAGLMGCGIAMSCAEAGLSVVLLDVNEETVQKGLSGIQRNYAIGVKRGSIRKGQVDRWLSKIATSTSYDSLKDRDLVIEAVYENLELKQKIFKQLDAVCKVDAFMCSNTSALDIDAIAAVTSRPDRVMGTHFFSPANKMRLLENVRGKLTSPETIASMMAFGKAIRKVPALVGNCPGFVGNRMIYLYSQQANEMLLEGAFPAQIDRAAVQFGMRMGPFQMADLVGLDLRYRQRQTAGIDDPKGDIRDALCASGRLGQKNGRGFYLYDRATRARTPDKEVEEVIVGISQHHGIQRRDISDQEILERLFYPLINEGFRILEEGIAQRPSDIDVIYHLGYGFPRFRGGPMFMADRLGLPNIQRALRKRLNIDPAPLLSTCIEHHSSLADFWASQENPSSKL